MYVLCTLASNSVPWCRKFISLFLDRRNESVRENKVQSSIRRLNLWFSFVPAWKSHIDIDVFYKIQFAVVYRNTRTIVSRFTGVTLIFIKKRGGRKENRSLHNRIRAMYVVWYDGQKHSRKIRSHPGSVFVRHVRGSKLLLEKHKYTSLSVPARSIWNLISKCQLARSARRVD